MGKISLIIQREYLTRVRKRSFIIMTILGPLLMAGVAIVPVWLASANESVRSIVVLDETGMMDYQLQSNPTIQFSYSHVSLEDAKRNLEKSGNYALVYIPKAQDDNLIVTQRSIKLYSPNQVSLNVKIYIENQLEKQLERAMLKANGVDKDLV